MEVDANEWIDPKQDLPPKKEGWSHSEMVLVWYEGVPNEKVAGYGLAYYHYDPPYQQPSFIDFKNYNRQPIAWTKLPKPPNKN